MTFFTIILCALFLFSLYNLYQHYANKRRAVDDRHNTYTRVSNALRTVANFNATDRHIADDNTTVVAIDGHTRNVCFIAGTLGTPQVFAPDDILAVEIVEDGTTLTSTNRGSQILGAAVGGVAFGALGAVVGGLSASSTSSDKTRRLELKVVVNDVTQPVRLIPFIAVPYGNGILKSSEEYRTSREKAFHWHALLSHVIKQPASGA